MLHNPPRCYFAFSLFLFLCFAAVLFVLSLSFIPLRSKPVFLSHTEQWACQDLFFASNSNTIYQHYGKKRRLIWHTDRQIYISIIIVACSLFCAPTSWLFMFMFLFFSLAFHRFRSFPFENKKKIFGNKRSTFSKDREGKTTLRLCSRFLCKVTLGIIERGFVFNTN